MTVVPERPSIEEAWEEILYALKHNTYHDDSGCIANESDWIEHKQAIRNAMSTLLNSVEIKVECDDPDAKSSFTIVTNGPALRQRIGALE